MSRFPAVFAALTIGACVPAPIEAPHRDAAVIEAGASVTDARIHDSGVASAIDSGVADSGPLQQAAPRYRDILELDELAIARTCSLNGGVCHNSKEYPDLHSVSSLLATVMQPCNQGLPDPRQIQDVCEREGDRLIIASAGFDREVLRIQLFPAGAARDDLTSATLYFDGPVGAIAGARDLQFTRDSTSTFDLASSRAVARTSTADASALVIDLGSATRSAKSFLDARVFPWRASMLRVADANGNGTAGRLHLPVIAPGDAMGSYLILRLIDESFGERMPRQCRTWDDEATQALGCWIEGLQVENGGVINAYDPIDYASCSLDLDGLGRCEAPVVEGFGGVEALIARSCGGSSCHVGERVPAGQLDLSPGAAYDSLVGVRSSQVMSMERIRPGDPGASYLFCKLSADCPARIGQRMPLNGTPLTDEELDVVRRWIESGAAR